MYFVLFLSIVSFSLNLFAQNPNAFSLQYQPQAIQGYSSQRLCENNYLERIKAPGVLNIAVALGYSDTSNEGFNLVTDGWLQKTLVTQLTQSCQYAAQGFCEFKTQYAEPHDVQLYTRELTLSDNSSLLVNVYVMNSSYDMSNEDNLTIYKNEQNIKTEKAQNFYGWAIQNADVVFYEGHSRDGGGPDFAPPITTRSGKVNYSWYHKHKPGLKFLLSQLEQLNKSPMIFGLFSCASQPHFQSKLSKYFNASNTIMSTKVVVAHYTKEALLYSLESILNFECTDQLSSRLKGSSFIINRHF